MEKYRERVRAFLPLLLCSLLLAGWPAWRIEIQAATADELEQSIKEKEEAISQAQEQKEQIAGLVLQANELGLDREAILNGAQAFYEKYGSQLVESANEAIQDNIVEPAKEAVVTETKKTLREYFHDMGETVKNFVMDLIG